MRPSNGAVLFCLQLWEILLRKARNGVKMRQGSETTQEKIEQMREELRREKLKKPGLLKAAGPGQVRNVLGWFLFMLAVGALVFTLVTVYIVKSRGDVPSLPGGFSLFVVESGSMEPALNIGSVILTRKPDDARTLKQGDIVTFRTLSGHIVTHRVIETLTDNGEVKYRTKGDNIVNSPDAELLSPERVIGVFVLKIPFT